MFVYILLITLIIFLLILFLACGHAFLRKYEASLVGIWAGDPAFLDAAGLREMRLFLAPPRGGEYGGYLFMVTDRGEVISNNFIEIRLSPYPTRWKNAVGSLFRGKKDALFFDAKLLAGASPLPSRLRLSLSLVHGCLALYDDKKLWGFLEKDFQTSKQAMHIWFTPSPQ